jgi:hypothetical protein
LFTTFAVGLFLALPFLPFAEAASDGRTISGTILVPSVTVPTTPALVGGVLTRHARCLYLVAGPAANGVVGWVEGITPAEGGAAFTLTSSTGGADPDVVFYADLGSCDSQVAPPIVLGSAEGPGAEAGTIPAGTNVIIVVIEGAPNAAFDFTIS